MPELLPAGLRAPDALGLPVGRAALRLRVCDSGTVSYHRAWELMRGFTAYRDRGTEDALWFLQHPPVFTLGCAGRLAHLHDAGDIPVCKSDRGGQLSYHGPGQLLGYLLLDLRRRALGVRQLVCTIEQVLVQLLAEMGLQAAGDRKAPGVYVDGAKIAALGLRIRRGCCYHGFSLNIAPDLQAFARIDPCGFPGLRVTSLEALLPPPARWSEPKIRQRLATLFGDALEYGRLLWQSGAPRVPASPRV